MDWFTDDEVKNAIEHLPENFRLAVLLADVEGFSYKEIAQILEIPIGTVMSRLHRGRKALQKELYEYALQHGLTDRLPEPGGAGPPSPSTASRPTPARPHTTTEPWPNNTTDHDHGPFDCEAALAEIYTYLDGELTDEKRVLIASHIEGCNPCFEAFDFEAELRMVISTRCRNDELPEIRHPHRPEVDVDRPGRRRRRAAMREPGPSRPRIGGP